MAKRDGSDERRWAVQMVLDHEHEYPSRWATIEAVAPKLHVSRESLWRWVMQADVDAGARPGVSSEDQQRIRELARTNRELREANEMLKAPASFFARELDPRRR